MAPVSRRPGRQRGQALLLVLVFVAAFLLLVWAGLTLASAGFLSLNAVQRDTRSTYALDAGLDYAMAYIRAQSSSSSFVWLTTTSVPNQTVPAGSYTFTLDVKGSSCHAAPKDCPTTVTYGYCTGSCGTLQAAMVAFSYDITAGGSSVLPQSATGAATVLTGCPCYFYVRIQTAIPSGEHWQLGYNGQNAGSETNIVRPGGEIWLLDSASTVNVADKTLGPQGTSNKNLTFTPGAACGPLAPPTLALTYPSGTITVSITMTANATCTAANLAYNLAIRASSTTRTLNAEVTHSAGGWHINWAKYQ